MAGHEKKLTLSPAEWGADADRLIGQAAPYNTLPEIAAQVQDGPAKLFHLTADGAIVGAFVLRVDHTATGSEGVIVAAAGHIDGLDLVDTCLPAVESLFRGCRRIRYHTGRPALARKLTRSGYQAREIVCFKDIAP